MSAKRLINLVIVWCLWTGTQAQEVVLRSGFLQDSMEVGQEVDYWITARYPASLEVVFPDSL